MLAKIGVRCSEAPTPALLSFACFCFLWGGLCSPQNRYFPKEKVWKLETFSWVSLPAPLCTGRETDTKTQGLAEGPTEVGGGGTAGRAGRAGGGPSWHGAVSHEFPHADNVISLPPPPELPPAALLRSRSRQNLPRPSLTTEPWHRGPWSPSGSLLSRPECYWLRGLYTVRPDMMWKDLGK